MKRRILIAVVAVVALVAWLISRQDRAFQRATYQGRHVRLWAQELYPSFDPRGTNEAMTAFHVMGSNAVPVLRSMLGMHAPLYEKPVVQNARRIPVATRRYLFEKLKPGRAVGLRVAAARALGVIGPEARAAVPDLIAALEDNYPEVRWAAAQALARIGGEAIPALAETATNENTTLRHAAVYALGEAGTNAAPATAVLFNCVLDTNETVRASALYSLSRVGALGVPVVLEAFSTDDAARRDAAVKTIRAMNTPPRQVLRTLLEFSTNSNPSIRARSLEALQVLPLNHPKIITTYLQALSDPDPGVRAAAARAMSQANRWTTNRELSEVTTRLLGLNGTLHSNIVTSLIGLLNDPEPAVRSAAQQTLNSPQFSTN